MQYGTGIVLVWVILGRRNKGKVLKGILGLQLSFYSEHTKNIMKGLKGILRLQLS